jgi:hypothetical protein
MCTTARGRCPVPGNQRAGYRPGRDDTRWSKLERELAAAQRADPFEPYLARAAELNDQLAGRWHVWFVAQGTSTVEWLARPVGNGDPLLSAATADLLVAQIEEAER